VKIPEVEVEVEIKIILEVMVVLVYVYLPGKSNLQFFFRNKKRTIIIPVFTINY